jgi:hypothetical protein
MIPEQIRQISVVFKFKLLDAGSGFVIYFIWLLQDVTTSNCNGFNKSRALQFNIAGTNSSQSSYYLPPANGSQQCLLLFTLLPAGD